MVQARVAQQVGQPIPADLAIAQVGVAIVAGAQGGVGVVEMDHHQAMQADQAVEVGEEVDRSRPVDTS